MRAICSILAVFILVSFTAACGNENTSPTVNIDGVTSSPAPAQTTSPSPSPSPTPTPSPTPSPSPTPVLVFEESTDLRVIHSFVGRNDINIIVENISDRPILNYSLAYVSFDRNGFSVGSNRYDSGRVTAANLMPGAKDIASFWSSNTGTFILATVSRIEYVGGDNWEAIDIGTWADDTIATFTPQIISDMIEGFVPQAERATENEFLQILSTNKQSRNRFSSSDDFDITLRNTSDDSIRSARFMVLQFDGNGFPVNVSPWDTYLGNARPVSGELNLTPDSTRTVTASLFFNAQCVNYVCIVWSIEFIDGETWENPYRFEWLIVSSREFVG
jgi:hypothetical protein